MKNITVLNNQEVLGKQFTVYGDIDNPLFLAKDVADMIEHSNPRMMLKSVDEDEKQCVNNPYASQGQQEQWFLTEYGLYEVLMQSRKPIAKEFKKEIKSILKQLRKTGVVITESATQEAIDYQARYGKYRIRKTFENTKDIRAEYEQYFELSKIECKAHHINNKDRINGSKIIINMIQEKIANEVQDMRPSELLALQELVNDIQVDITKLSNKLNGGQKSALTKQINALQDKIDTFESQQFKPDWKLIQNHGYTENTKLEYNESLHRLVNTKSYNAWKRNFDYSDFRELNCDITKPMIIYLHFGKLDKFDASNLEKTVIDLIANYYGFNDKLIVSKIMTCEIVDSYEEGFIYFDLINEE